MNETRPLSDYLRLPYRLGAGLTHLDAASPDGDWLDAAVRDDVTDAVATVLREGVTALRKALPDTTCHVVYLRGSPVFDRITLIAPVWQQALDLLDLEPVLAALRSQWGDERVDTVLGGARRKMAQDLLGLDTKSGVAKPLYRLRPPDDALYAPSNRATALALVEAMPRLLDATDEGVRDIVRATTVLKLRPGLEGHFQRVLVGLGAGELADRVIPRVGEALSGLITDLNPLLPLTTDAIARVRDAFALDNAGDAGEALSLLRFAVVTLPLLRPKTTSDLAFRTLTVVPEDADVGATEAAVLAVVQALDAGDTLSRLRAAHPNLEVSIRPYVLQSAPADDAAAYLELAARYRTNEGSLPHSTRVTLTSVRDLADPNWRRFEPADQRLDAVEKLSAAAEAPSEATVDALGESLFESTSVDIVAKVRGLTWP